MIPKKQQFGRAVTFCKQNLFLICILLGVLFGGVTGLLLRSYKLDKDTITVISYPGEIFMRGLKLLVLPFIICCIIIGAATLNISKNKKIAIRTIVYFVVTSLFNVMLGLSLAIIFHPGNLEITTGTKKVGSLQQTDIVDGFLDMGRNIVPDNLFQSAFQQTFTIYDRSNNGTILNKKLSYKDGTNMMGIIFFCLLFGAVLGTLGPKKHIIIEFFTIFYETLQKILIGIIWFTPIGVASIICGKVVSVENLGATLLQLSYFISCTVGGFLFYQLIVMQLIYYFITKKNPYRYYFNCMPAIATAFATASKSASLPITFQVLEDKMKMNKKITRFVLPIGTINMDGSALYLSAALIFLTQLNHKILAVSDIITIGLACTAASMSSAAIPSAAIVLVLMLCSIINLPTENVGLLLAIDWFVDRFRTVNNLLGDCYTVAIVEHLSRNELQEKPEFPLNESLNSIRSTEISINMENDKKEEQNGGHIIISDEREHNQII